MNPTQPAPYPLRMPPELRNLLSARAQANGRSLNAEIVALLQHAMDDGALPDLDRFAERIAEKVAGKLKGK